MLRALFTRALQTNSISKIPELYNDFSSAIITDLTLPDLLQLAPLALHLTNADIRSFYIGKDLVTSWMTPGGASVQLPNGPAIQSMLQQALCLRTPYHRSGSPDRRSPQWDRQSRLGFPGCRAPELRWL